LNELTAKSSLSDPQRRLVELMQRLNFGRIEDLIIRGGEPVFDPAPKVIQKVKIGGENGPRPEVTMAVISDIVSLSIMRKHGGGLRGGFFSRKSELTIRGRLPIGYRKLAG
jgi:hypothetical protein